MKYLQLEIAEPLLIWYQRNKRDLPWRSNPTCYKTVVSEFMLQQTRVETVLPYFKNWLTKFPSFKILAESDENEVMKAWEGLGYYSRARNLRKLAIKINNLETIPKTQKEWLVLPGIGPYTSAAISSICFNEKDAVVDGNVVRVLTRIKNIETEFKDGSQAVKILTPLANELLCEKYPGDYNQAIMELGATVCHKQKPLCILCPVQKQCESFKNQSVDQKPKIKPKKIVKKEVNRVISLKKDRILLHKNPTEYKRLANVYEIPTLEQTGLKNIETMPFLLKNKRSISNERITEFFYYYKEEKDVSSKENLHWVQKHDLGQITLSGPHKKWIFSLIESCESCI